MDAGAISQVRRFNRIVTRQVGALDDRFLARDRPLAEARLLWEIGVDGRDVRSLRAVLDRRSDRLAASLLAPLGAAQRARLVAAMAEVERLLTAAMVEVAPIDPAHPHARRCLEAYFSELDRRFNAGFDPARSIVAHDEELRPPAGLLLVASLRGDPIGCGALRLHGDGPAEIKRMWVAESARGLGLGRRLLTELEVHAADHGARAVRLETNRTLIEAIALYRSAGYVEVTPFNEEAYADHWFEKRL